MKFKKLIVLSVVVSAGGCANPINQVTADNYQQTCFAAEHNGNLLVAEEACGRALTNVAWGNLGPAEQSQKQYNLARIKRQLAKFPEAEELMKQSLAIEESLPSPSPLRIGRRLVELSASLAGQEKWKEGAPYLTRAYELRDHFSPREKKYTAEVLAAYSEEFQREGNTEAGLKFAAMASAIEE